MKKVAILQSNYIPWKGYLDLIAAVDEFILYDDMQFTRRDWRNRNQIKTSQGLHWLTVPVSVKGKYFQTIYEAEIDGNDWARAHWKMILQNYKRAPYFDEISTLLQPLYLERTHTHISHLNEEFIKVICNYIGIKTKISQSCDFTLLEGKTERLADLCAQVDGTEYISGPAARNYIEERFFSERNIKLTWFNYDGYSEYPQLWGGFEHGVSIVDLLFNCGPNASQYMRFVK